MDHASFVLAVIGVVLATLALALPIGIERLRRPRLVVRAGEWSPREDLPWEFVVIGVANEPLTGFLGHLFTRQSAEGCEVSLTFTREGIIKPPIYRLPARWSGHPEPYRLTPAGVSGGQPRLVPMFDHALVPPSYRWDVAPTGRPEEVAVAVRRDGEAHAFSAESYAYDRWRKGEWKLEPGNYQVAVRAGAAGAEAARTFGLVVTERDEFELRELDDSASRREIRAENRSQ